MFWGLSVVRYDLGSCRLLKQLASNAKINFSQPLSPQHVCNQGNHSVIKTTNHFLQYYRKGNPSKYVWQICLAKIDWWCWLKFAKHRLLLHEGSHKVPGKSHIRHLWCIAVPRPLHTVTFVREKAAIWKGAISQVIFNNKEFQDRLRNSTRCLIDVHIVCCNLMFDRG